MASEPILDKTHTVTLRFRDIWWHQDDARRAVEDAAGLLADQAKYHRAVVCVDGVSLTAHDSRIMAELATARGRLDVVRADLAAVTAERDAQIRDFQILHAERNALAEGFAEAKHDRATLLEAIEVFEHALDDAGGASTVALFETAFKIRERSDDGRTAA